MRTPRTCDVTLAPACGSKLAGTDAGRQDALYHPGLACSGAGAVEPACSTWLFWPGGQGLVAEAE
ncbi:hypothetical protein HaLaN_14695, partial [Haematococcus lacustris]